MSPVISTVITQTAKKIFDFKEFSCYTATGNDWPTAQTSALYGEFHTWKVKAAVMCVDICLELVAQVYKAFGTDHDVIGILIAIWPKLDQGHLIFGF